MLSEFWHNATWALRQVITENYPDFPVTIGCPDDRHDGYSVIASISYWEPSEIQQLSTVHTKRESKLLARIDLGDNGMVECKWWTWHGYITVSDPPYMFIGKVSSSNKLSILNCMRDVIIRAKTERGVSYDIGVTYKDGPRVNFVSVGEVWHESMIDTGEFTKIQQDEKGVLFRDSRHKDDGLILVVRNPNNEQETFLLRVPTNMRTAQEAVAWTFSLEPEEYQIIQEA